MSQLEAALELYQSELKARVAAEDRVMKLETITAQQTADVSVGLCSRPAQP